MGRAGVESERKNEFLHKYNPRLVEKGVIGGERECREKGIC